MGRGPLLRLNRIRRSVSFHSRVDLGNLMRSYLGFLRVIPLQRAGHPRVTHPFATVLRLPKKSVLVRLACVRHAASVDSEPGSNSQIEPGPSRCLVVKDHRACPKKKETFFLRQTRYTLPFLPSLLQPIRHLISSGKS